jgi:hypothetical protein
MSENQRVSIEQLEKIRKLDDFDLVMLISEIHDHGWPLASCTLDIMPVDGVPPDPETVKVSGERASTILRRQQVKGIA